MWKPSSESEETRHLNAKQANEITLRQIKNATLRQKGHHAAAAIATADDFELESLLPEDVDGHGEKCNKQQLLPHPTKNETHATLSDAVIVDTKFPIASDRATMANVVTSDGEINVGSTDNDDNATVVSEKQTEQLKCYKMTQYGNTGSQAHSKLDIQKIPEGMQQRWQQQHRHQHQHQQQQLQRRQPEKQQNFVTVISAQPTSLNATTTTSTQSLVATISAPAIAQGVGVTVNAFNTGNINNENDGTAPPRADTAAHCKGPKFWQYIVRYWATTSQKLALFVIFLLLWALAYCILPNYASPETSIMRLVFLFVGAELAGILVTHLHLPDMLGMLFFGVLYANLGLADFSGYQKLEAILRELALINIMLLAGLGLNASAFKKLWFMVLRLAVLPTVAEVGIITVLAKFLLNMPWLWGVLLGLVITAVSPNVVVTVMLKLKEDHLGLNNGIHTIIYASTTCNDVLAIFAFGVVLGVIFSTGSLASQILQGPVGIGIGVVFGYVYGMMLQYLPSTKSSYMNGLRFVLTTLGGCIAVMGSKAIGYPSAGALGCASLAFIASIGWKRQQRQMSLEQQHANENSGVPKRLDLLWKFLKPVSFALIGKEIKFSELDGSVVGYGLMIVTVGSVFRLVFAYASTYGGGLTWRERAYITISGFPKATVQAALGPIALDLARSFGNIDPEQISLAGKSLIVSVLAIIFTAPLGAILMLRLAPFWLPKCAAESPNDEVTIHAYDNKKSGESDANNVTKFKSTSNLCSQGDESQCNFGVANALSNEINNDDVIVVNDRAI